MIPETLANKYIDEYNKHHRLGVWELEEMTAFAREYGAKSETDALGVLIGTKRNAEGKLMLYETKEPHHVLVSAATGLGKTQGYVLNTACHLSGKTSMIITDPKGEVTRSARNLLAMQYGEENVGILNFREPSHTLLRYNPFKAVAEEYRDTGKLPPAKKEEARERIIAKLQTLISEIFPIRTSDTTWDAGSRELIFAIVLGLIEDTSKDSFTSVQSSRTRKLLTPNEVTIAKVVKIFSQFSWHPDSGSWGDHGFFSSRSEKSQAKQHAMTVLGISADTTRSIHLSLVNSFLEPYCNPKILDITSDHTVDVLKMSHTPQILFVIYDMADEANKRLVNDFLVNALSLLRDEYSQSGKPLEIPVTLLCDEFSSLSAHSIYPNILSVGRGMNIFLHLIIQSTAQLRSAYKQDADVITENCGVKLFLGTNSYETGRAFLDEVGTSVQLSKTSLLSGKIAFAEQPRIPIDKILYQMEKGECFVKITNTPPIHSFFEMSYQTPEHHLLPEFDLSSVVAPKVKKQKPSPEETKEQTDDEEDARIKEARAALEKRKAEILARMEQLMVDEDEDEDEEDEILREEVEDAIDCLKPLSESELDIIEMTIESGYISEEWILDHTECDERVPSMIIDFLLQLGIVKKSTKKRYKYLFSYKVFKKARKKLQ